MIASPQGNIKDVHESMLDEKEARCLLFAEAADRGASIWGSFVFKRDVVGPIPWRCLTVYQSAFAFKR